jgi:hypothetical protein
MLLGSVSGVSSIVARTRPGRSTFFGTHTRSPFWKSVAMSDICQLIENGELGNSLVYICDVNPLDLLKDVEPPEAVQRNLDEGASAAYRTTTTTAYRTTIVVFRDLDDGPESPSEYVGSKVPITSPIVDSL